MFVVRGESGEPPTTWSIGRCTSPVPAYGVNQHVMGDPESIVVLFEKVVFDTVGLTPRIRFLCASHAPDHGERRARSSGKAPSENNGTAWSWKHNGNMR
jgi:hypothetical protein